MRYLWTFILLIACGGGGDGMYLTSIVPLTASDPTIETQKVCVEATVYSDLTTLRDNRHKDLASDIRGWWINDNGHKVHFVKGDMMIAGHEFIHALLYESNIEWGEEHFDES